MKSLINQDGAVTEVYGYRTMKKNIQCKRQINIVSKYFI